MFGQLAHVTRVINKKQGLGWSGYSGSFFATGFAKIRCKPSNIAFTDGWADSESKPEIEWAQANALQASSAADLDVLSSPIYYKYRTKSCGLAGIGCSF